MSKHADPQKAALNTAANVLQYRNRSKKALLERLLEKGIEEEHAQYAVTRLEELGYLNDETFACDLAESLKNRGYGRRRVKEELWRKKLEPHAVEAALEQFEADEDQLEAFIAKKLGDTPPQPKDIKRVYDALIRRGFSWDEARQAMKKYLHAIEEDFEY